MSDENSLAKLGDLTKPATVLIEKISEAVGGVFKPYQIVRIAKAEAEANLIQAESHIQITDLHRRVMYRFLEEEAKKQSNIEAITQSALPLLEDKSSPECVSDDWITNFFDKSRIVSDAEMQALWSRVLAGEANAPGTFAKRTVNLMADLDREDAELFSCLCGFGWEIETLVPLVFDTRAEIYNQKEINFDSLSHLKSLGLIQYNEIAGFSRFGIPKAVTALYYGRPLTLTFPAEADNILDIGKVLLTRAGQQLAPICGSKSVDGFFEFVHDKWASQSLVPKRETEPIIPPDAAR